MKYFKYMLFMLMLFVSINMRGQYNPENPIEPGVYYTMTLKSSPSEAGSFNINKVTSYSEGTNVRIRAYNAYNFRFVAWEENGSIISKESELVYTMPARNVVLTAHYKYDPSSPSEPEMPLEKHFSILKLISAPSGAGSFNINSGNKYEVGTSVFLRVYSNTDFVFEKWTENGEIISTSQSFNYVMKDKNPELVAHFKYNPDSPSEPSFPRVYRKLYLESDPPGGGYFNEGSGNEHQEGTSIYLRAYSRKYYTFKNWTLDGKVISDKYDFYFTMPDKDTKLVAHYDYCYDPNNPGEPSEPDENNAIYGMTENVVKGQLTHYPIYFENKEAAAGVVYDIQFPKGFVVNTEDIILSSRVSTHKLTVSDLGENNYRISLLGTDCITGNNGKLMEIPVSVPLSAVMGEKYPVRLSHGVLVHTDESEIPVSVRSGNLLVEKISEDGLYARFSYDKLNNRVKFNNLSSDKAKRYEWDFGDGMTSTEKEPLHMFEKPGTYIVKLTSFGEYDKDIAEQTVLINEKNTWKTEGNYFISDKILGSRYFTTVDSLLDFLSQSYATGNVRLSILAGKTFDSDVSDKNIQIWNKLFTSLASANSNLVINKWKSGRNPELLLGKDGSSLNPLFVDLFTKNGSRIICDGVDIKFWNISYNPHKIKLLNNQCVRSGDKTEEWDFSSISLDLNYTWILGALPDGISGALLKGTGKIPSMTIRNVTDDKIVLTYSVVGDYKGQVFCEFTKQIEVKPELVGLFTNLKPINGTVSESTTVTLTWNDIKNAVYDVYLWDAENSRPNQPVAKGITDLRYVSSNFCQNGSYYKWQIIARNENQQIESDTMNFSVRSLPDLHVYALNCSEATAGKKFTVEWDVKNDGLGSTGNANWYDYVWLVTDVYGGTKPSGTSDNHARLLATVKNVKSLEVGESYHNKVDIVLDERIYGNHYVIVASDMYSISDIEWSAIGGSVINPYTPAQDGSSYKHLYAKTSASYNKLYERDETETYSDNFFYKKIDISIPPLVDLQIPKITSYVIPDEELNLGIVPITKPSLITWEECYVPSPITAAGLRKTESFYSGKKLAVEINVANKGGKSVERPFKVAVYMSDSQNRDESSLIYLGTVDCTKYLKVEEDTTLTFTFYMPYEWYGDTYFHAYADIDDNVYELVNTENNWGKSDKVDILLCPGADFVPSSFFAQSSISSTSSFDISYKVSNKGSGIPYRNTWIDKIYISKNNKGLDNSAKLLSSKEYKGQFKSSLTSDSLPENSYTYTQPEYYKYKGDNYKGNFTVTPSGLTSGDYYLYLKVDADENVYEYDGENNNVLRFGPLKYVQPDLSVELLSISDDTLSTAQEVCFTWKIKNTGSCNLENVKITDAFYASVNQDGANATLLGKVENNLWIASGADKILRTNMIIPSIKGLDGLRYIFIKTNVDKSIGEESETNNSSSLIKSWFKYVSDPSKKKPTVKGGNLYVTDINFVNSIKPGEHTTVNYIVHNNGEMDIADKDILHEVYVSNYSNVEKEHLVKCEVLEQFGNARNLRAGEETSISQTIVIPQNIKGGDKYLHVVVDPENKLLERNASDNKSKRHFYMNGNLADLKVKDIIIADTIRTSVESVVNFTVYNEGEWKASDTRTALYLSSDKIYDDKDIPLNDVKTEALLKNGETRHSLRFIVNDDKFGKWFVLVRCDDQKDVQELNENNNMQAVPVTIIQSPLPDIYVKSISTDKISNAGQPINIHTVIENKGVNATRTDKWSDTYYLSTNSILNTDEAIKIGSKMHFGKLGVGESYENNVTFNLPPMVQGNYMLFVVSDASNSITESDENNNNKGVAIYINGASDTPSDLAVSNINVPAVIKAGDEFTFSYELSNVGEFTAEGEINDVIYLSKDNRWDKDDVMVGIVKGKKTIHPGNVETRTVTGRITNVPEGEYYLIINTNSTKIIVEQNLENNTAVVSSPCKLVFTSIHLSGNATVNTSGYYKLDIPNGYDGKTVGLYLEHPEDAAAGLYAAYENIPSTARYDFALNSSSQTEKELLIPNVKAGNYYILAQDNRALVNSSGNVFSETNDESMISTTMKLNVKEVNFGATNLSVKQGGNGGWVSTEINGALLDSIMDFRLQSGKKVIPIETLTYESMTRTRVTFNLNDANVGNYDLLSELPNGKQAVLSDGFKVVPGASVNLRAKIDAPSVVRLHNYAPITVSYANGGNTDISVYKLMLVIDNGYLGTSIKDLDRHQSVLYLDLETDTDSRGYTSIAPGVQKTLNLFMYQTARTSNISIYVIK